MHGTQRTSLRLPTAVPAVSAESEVRTLRLQPFTVETGGRGDRDTRSGRVNSRPGIVRKAAGGVMVSALMAGSALGLVTATAPVAAAAPAAPATCKPGAVTGWSTGVGDWKTSDGGKNWAATGDTGFNRLDATLNDVPSSGAQIEFDVRWDQAGDQHSRRADLDIHYGGTQYARLVTPRAGDANQTARWEVLRGATISPAAGSDLSPGTTHRMVLTLPSGVPTSGNLVVFGRAGNGSGQADDLSFGNMTVSSTTCTDLAVTQSAPAAVQPNGKVTWDLGVTNNGPSAGDYTVTDKLPAGVTAAGTSTAGCTLTGSDLTCKGTNLAVGETRKIQVVGTAPNAAGTTLTSSASVTGAKPDPVASNNSASAKTNIDPVLGGPVVDPLVASAAIGAAGLVSVGVAARRRASRVRV
ncbi:DUF11 domain-containing protein [Streptomyces sp. NPDC048637]|uniref:DUF11 domain-containing protein n=1 Tax=Streptomyces sp. NPDC048637 TaxID=3155636 RepID=UPI0034204CC2